MKAIKAKGLVKADHSVVLQLPEDIQPGEHVFILVVEDGQMILPLEPAPQSQAPQQWPSDFFSHVLGQWQGDLEREQPDLPAGS